MLFSPAVPKNTTPTLADVRAACLASRGNVTYRKAAVAALDALACRLGMPAHAIVLDFGRLRHDLVLQCVLEGKRDGAELWHGVTLAIRMSCLVPILSSRRSPSPDPRWLGLEQLVFPLLGECGRQHWSLFVASATACGLEPADITDHLIEEWTIGLGWIRTRDVVGMVIRDLTRAWNALGGTHPDLSLQRLAADDEAGRHFLLPWRIYPQSLRDDIAKALRFAAEPVDLGATLPPETATRLTGVKDVTANHYERRLKACCSAYVRGGGHPRDLISLHSLLCKEGFSKVVAGHLARGPGGSSFDASEDCRILILVGGTFHRLGADIIKVLEAQMGVFSGRSFDLHGSRRDFLERLKDPAVRRVFAALPEILFDAAAAPTQAGRLSLMQSGLVVDLSRSAPLEPGFWLDLRWDHHVKLECADARPGRLLIPRCETNKTLDLEYDIPAATADRLRLYRRAREDNGEPNRLVFSNRSGRLNSEQAFNTMVRTTILDFVDLSVCLTDLRFLSEYVFLRKNPENLEGARQAFGLNSASPLVPLSEFLLQERSARAPILRENPPAEAA